MTPYFETGYIQIFHGDAREVLSNLDIEATACVTDPPYGLAFMGRSWDDFEPREYQDWCMEWGEIVMDVLLPGAPVLAFSGTRTAHRLTCGLEDAGLVIRDRLAWMYGSGFPKSHDISKAIDDAKGVERDWYEVPRNGGGVSQDEQRIQQLAGGKSGVKMESDPATEEAETWDGYGTALAPSHEPITLAMKPKDGTFAENALRHGVAGLNIDAARIETNGERPNRRRSDADTGRQEKYGDFKQGTSRADGTTTQGRWPANVVLDEAAAELLDRQSGADCGQSGAVTGTEPSFDEDTRLYGDYSGQSKVAYPRDDGGGASRFFYTAKASKSDRNAGLPPGEENGHPTVKPTDLMGWLLRLVEMPGQNLILDPFCGSGTTLYVAQQMGLPAIGIDQDEESCELASKRLSEPSLFS